ncbi:MAG: ATP-binding cassette domain-containing protein [Sulfolobales archaeon]|nr:ATP-binding cassette domain-containing protein [Sulfolobales archaeon]MCX8209061.1 ATP-binding cassette domain-containing protein [Sulfolobales archaeon]MDW8009982.1 ATP-binding cassette domain-containing protein [Sulfolobales archaeon]
MEVTLELRNVSVAVGSRVVLSSVNMKIGYRELHVLVGPNGSGKTSLLNAVVGIKPYEVVSGQVLLMGEDVTREPPNVKARKGLVLAHQLPPVVKGVVVGKFVEELARRFDVKKSYVDMLSEILEVGYLMDRYLFDKMSGGERKRLETFLTLLTRPRVALLDEPDSGVDIDSLNTISNALRAALNLGTSLLLVTHSLHMIKLLREYVNTIHVVYGGALLMSGLYDEVVPLVEKHGFSGLALRFSRGGFP